MGYGVQATLAMLCFKRIVWKGFPEFLTSWDLDTHMEGQGLPQRQYEAVSGRPRAVLSPL